MKFQKLILFAKNKLLEIKTFDNEIVKNRYLEINTVFFSPEAPTAQKGPNIEIHFWNSVSSELLGQISNMNFYI